MVALPEIIETFKDIIELKSDEPVYLVYDTTFNLGDCYVSPIVFKHVLFEESPLVPLAFLIHERKTCKMAPTFMNAVLKRENDWKELPVDLLALGFYYIQNFENYEILRGRSGMGNYHLKAELKRAFIPPSDLILPKRE